MRDSGASGGGGGEGGSTSMRNSGGEGICIGFGSDGGCNGGDNGCSCTLTSTVSGLETSMEPSPRVESIASRKASDCAAAPSSAAPTPCSGAGTRVASKVYPAVDPAVAIVSTSTCSGETSREGVASKRETRTARLMSSGCAWLPRPWRRRWARRRWARRRWMRRRPRCDGTTKGRGWLFMSNGWGGSGPIRRLAFITLRPL